MAFPALAASLKVVTPPDPGPGLPLMMVAFPAVELISNPVLPPLLAIIALPAVAVPKKNVPPFRLLVIVALPAVDELKNSASPPALLVIVARPAEALS